MFEIFAWKLRILFTNMCASMQIERQLNKINPFNGLRLITVIARSKIIFFLPKHGSLTEDIMLKKLISIQRPFHCIDSSNKQYQSKVKIASFNAHNDSPCKTQDNGLFCAVGKERNITRR